jgi:TonB-linked SusC/RagA family outer membrane protein
MRKFTLFLALIFFIGMQVVHAQTSTVTGTVTNAEDGSTIPGVSVVVKGTTFGTTTDLQGKYTLNVPPDAQSLIFSFVGMRTTERAIAGQSVINVAMEPEITAIEGVVVTALGITREKKSLGYSSQGVSSEDVLKANNPNPISSLQGKVSGLSISGANFSGSQNILIRGASSFSQNNQPLFVVDGVPLSNENFNDVNTQIGGGGYDYGSMISDLNSYDIKDVEVLKGSAASALYGSRGQNGVIMITTKSGQAGKKTFSVELNSGMTFSQVSVFPELQDEYGGGYGFDKITIGGIEYDAVQYAVDESWGPRFEGQDVLHWWGIADYEQGITDVPVTGKWQASPNDVRDFYRTGIALQNSVNVLTTSSTTALRAGYTNVNLTGTVPNSSQNKHNINLNGTALLFDDIIEFNTTLNFVQTYTKGRPQFGYGDNSQSQKFFQWGQRQLDMEKLEDYKNPDGTQRTWNRIAWDNPTPQYSDNPYWTAYENYQDDDRTRVFGKIGLKAKLSEMFNATGNVYFDTYTFNQRERVAIGSQASSYYGQWNRQFFETNYEGKLNFRKDVSDFSVRAMAGGNIRKDTYSRFEGETSGGLNIPELYNLTNSKDLPVLDDFRRDKQVNSLFGYASIGYKGIVYVDFTYRNDWDSSLPEDENSYGYFSTSASFIISEFIDVGDIDNLKIRANYGETGNGTDPYQVFNVYTVGDPFNNAPQYTNSRTLNNSDLKPELTNEIELGFEGAFFQNRLGVDFSWYDRNTENQIVAVEVSGSNGYLNRVINAGLIQNTGVEFYVYGSPVRTQDFNWELGVNFAKNKNLVKDLPDGLDKLQLARAPFGGAYVNATEDATFQEIFVQDFVYDADGNKVINEETGFYETTGELTSVGSALPDYTMGVNTTLSYKNWDFGALLNVSKGGVYYSLTNMWGMYSGMAAGTVGTNPLGNPIRNPVEEGGGVLLEGVNGTITMNDDGTYTVSDVTTNETYLEAETFGAYHYHGNGTPSATSIFDASYIKLGEVTLGYTIPKFTDLIQSARISLYGRNLFVWGLDNKGIDPETTVGGSGNIQGLEGGIVPATRSFGFNLNINF